MGKGEVIKAGKEKSSSRDLDLESSFFLSQYSLSLIPVSQKNHFKYDQSGQVILYLVAETRRKITDCSVSAIRNFADCRITAIYTIHDVEIRRGF